MSKCDTRGCRREAAPGDFLCQRHRDQAVEKSRPLLHNPTYTGHENYEDDAELRRMRDGA